MQISIAAVISAAGSSNRMGGIKKEYLPLAEGNLTVLGSVVTAFASSGRIGPIVITVPQDPGEENAALASLPAELRPGELPGQKRIYFVPGGPTRRASVRNALVFLESCHPSHVLIHDGARPWIKPELIERVIDAAIKYGAVIPALPLVETPKELEPVAAPEDPEFPGVRFIKRHLRRAELCTAQTPQGFKFPEILAAHEKARGKEESACNAGETFEYTDDAEVWGEFIGQAAVIAGDPANRKITFPEDLKKGLGSGG